MIAQPAPVVAEGGHRVLVWLKLIVFYAAYFFLLAAARRRSPFAGHIFTAAAVTALALIIVFFNQQLGLQRRWAIAAFAPGLNAFLLLMVMLQLLALPRQYWAHGIHPAPRTGGRALSAVFMVIGCLIAVVSVVRFTVNDLGVLAQSPTRVAARQFGPSGRWPFHKKNFIRDAEITHAQILADIERGGRHYVVVLLTGPGTVHYDMERVRKVGRPLGNTWKIDKNRFDSRTFGGIDTFGCELSIDDPVCIYGVPRGVSRVRIDRVDNPPVFATVHNGIAIGFVGHNYEIKGEAALDRSGREVKNGILLGARLH
jgi:hypothetical protein